MCLPFLARHTRLHRTFLRSFWLGHGLWPKKVPLLLPLACSIVFALPPIPTNPPAQLLPLFSSPIPVQIHLRTLNLPSCAFAFRLCSHIFLGSQKSQTTVRGAAGAQLPLYTPALHAFPNLFYLFFASLPPRQHDFLQFFSKFARWTLKGCCPLSRMLLSCVLFAPCPS